jgi:hypothetical protein
MRKGKLIGSAVALLLGVGALWLCLPPPPQIQGSLTPQDATAITSTVHREMGRAQSIFPTFSWQSIRRLPGEIHRRRSDRILSIDVAADGTVEVRAGGAKKGTTYMLKKGPTKWEVINRRFWQSVCVTEPPNDFAGKRAVSAVTPGRDTMLRGRNIWYVAIPTYSTLMPFQ